MNDSTFTKRFNRYYLPLVAIGLLAAAPSVQACPFCSATAQTLSEELSAADVVVIAELVRAARMSDQSAEDSAGLAQSDLDSGMATFRVVEVLRGADQYQPLKEIKVVYYGEEDEGKRFFTTGMAGASKDKLRFDWTTPFPLSEQAQKYVRHLNGVPKTGADRIAFFQEYLENEDPLIAQDAYEEFARAPYAHIVDLKDRMKRESLLRWIEDPQVGPTRRRLYLTMLGVCGQAEDIQRLESLLRYDYLQVEPAVATMVTLAGLGGSALGVPLVDELVKADDRRQKQCLDALVASYLRLTGAAGLPLIEQRFLTNPNAEYTHLYSTIMALRFHGEECDVIPRERLLQSVRLLLDNDDVAEQVIPDLARWEDWSVLDRLVDMYMAADEQSWIRQPVIAYVLAAVEQPGDVGVRAAKALKQLEAIDPEGVKRSRGYLAVAFLARGGPAVAETEEPVEPEGPVEDVVDDSTPAEATVLPTTTDDTEAPPSGSELEPNNQEKASESEDEQPGPPSRLMIIGVPLVAVVVLMGVFAVLLRGADPRNAAK